MPQQSGQFDLPPSFGTGHAPGDWVRFLRYAVVDTKPL